MMSKMLWLLCAMMFQLCAMGCATAPRSTEDPLARQLISRLPRHDDFVYGYQQRFVISDVKTDQRYMLQVAQGGPSHMQDGGIGLYRGDQLIDSIHLPGLEGKIISVGRINPESYEPDTIVLSICTDHGTGVHREQLVACSVIDGKLVKTYQGAGNLIDHVPGKQKFQEILRRVSVSFIPLPGQSKNSLVLAYVQSIDGAENHDLLLFDFDPAEQRYIPAGKASLLKLSDFFRG